MPDLEPLTNFTVPPPIIQDPGVTRVLSRHADPAEVLELADVARTSCSFVLLDDQTGELEGAVGYLADTSLLNTTESGEAQIRRELLVVADGDRSRVLSSLRAGLYGTGVTWQICDKVLGGRASVLAEAVEYAANEFLVFNIGSGSNLDRIPGLLGHMWIEGADVGVISANGTADVEVGSGHRDDAAHRLTEWLGLAGSAPDGSLVMMRRWVARWLFNEISRSIDPAEELADRVRLLGLAIVHLS